MAIALWRSCDVPSCVGFHSWESFLMVCIMYETEAVEKSVPSSSHFCVVFRDDCSSIRDKTRRGRYPTIADECIDGSYHCTDS